MHFLERGFIAKQWFNLIIRVNVASFCFFVTQKQIQITANWVKIQ